MMWLVQAMGIDVRNGDKVMACLKKKSIPYIPVGVRPFSTEITGLDGVELEPGKVMAYGSTKLVKLTAEMGLTPGVFFDNSTFNAMAWNHFIPDEMVNSPVFATLREFRELQNVGAEHEMFVRPVLDLKLFSGTVKPAGTTFAQLLDEKLHGIEGFDNTLLAMSETRELHGEWRCFIVNRKLVTASQYRINGELKPDPSIPEGLEDYVAKICAKWLPHDHCAMDVALVTNHDVVKSKSFKVMEFNCINASGLYAADVGKLVDALNSLMV